MNAKQWIVTPHEFGIFFYWYQTTDQEITDRLEHDGVKRTEQEFVDAYYKMCGECEQE